jgi:hypothetical protein
MFGGKSSNTVLSDLWVFGQRMPSGTWTSQAWEAPPEGGRAERPVKWTSLAWGPESQSSGTLKFRLATNNDNATWNYVGPGGSSSTYYTVATGEALWSGHVGRFVRARAYLDTTSTTLTPELETATITYGYFDPPTALVVSPNGGEDWIYPRAYPITWKCSGELGTNPVKLEWSGNNGNSWTTITAATANDGIQNWTIPSYDTANASVRVTCTDSHGMQANDTSDSSFAIDPPPQMEVRFSSPPPGAIWGPGAHVISWDAGRISGSVDLAFTSDGGASWQSVAGGVPDSGTFPWYVPAINTRMAQVRLSGVDVDGNAVSSTGPHFVIDSTPPEIVEVAVAGPTGGVVTISAVVRDNFEVREVSAFVTRSGSVGFEEAPLTRAGEAFVGSVGAAGEFQYFVLASDGANEVSTSPARVGSAGSTVPVSAAALMALVAVLGGSGAMLATERYRRFVQPDAARSPPGGERHRKRRGPAAKESASTARER